MKSLEYSLRKTNFQVSCLRNETTLIGIGDSAFNVLDEYFNSSTEINSREAVVIADKRVWELHGFILKDKLTSLGVEYKILLVESGECSKSLITLNWVWKELASIGTKRRTTLLAFGGGVICDMAGFAAATYLRGIPYINIPTTLLAQIDAAIGGKVAVDTLVAKNALGAFYHPRAVIIWPGFLKTLPTIEIACGMAEIIKVITLASPAHFEEVESMGGVTTETISKINEDHLARWIQLKLDFLALDPFEVGSLDRALNFGHSFGHAIESATDYQSFRHGEAVAIGMSMACRIAVSRGILSQQIADRIISCIKQNHLPTELPAGLIDDVWESLEAVRHVRNGELREVLPVHFGDYRFVKDISRDEYLAARQDNKVINMIVGD